MLKKTPALSSACLKKSGPPKMAKATRRQLAVAITRLLDKNQPNLARQLAAFLITEGRTKELESLMRDVAALRHQQTGVLEITATSAHPLTPAIRDEIKQLLPAKSQIMHEELAPEVIGGIRLETVDTRIDLTVSARLNRLKQGLT